VRYEEGVVKYYMVSEGLIVTKKSSANLLGNKLVYDLKSLFNKYSLSDIV
jgi:hypothetical protein